MKIRIYGTTWQIVEAEPSACELAEVDGWNDPIRRIIFLDPTLDDDRRREVLVHEILHALYAEHHFPKKMAEEETATLMGKAFSVFLTENRKFVVDKLL